MSICVQIEKQHTNFLPRIWGTSLSQIHICLRKINRCARTCWANNMCTMCTLARKARVTCACAPTLFHLSLSLGAPFPKKIFSRSGYLMWNSKVTPLRSVALPSISLGYGDNIGLEEEQLTLGLQTPTSSVTERSWSGMLYNAWARATNAKIRELLTATTTSYY